MLTVEVSGSNSDTTHSVILLWTSGRSAAETYDNTQHSQKWGIHAPPPAWFEAANPASNWLHTHALDGTATSTNTVRKYEAVIGGNLTDYLIKILLFPHIKHVEWRPSLC